MGPSKGKGKATRKRPGDAEADESVATRPTRKLYSATIRMEDVFGASQHSLVSQAHSQSQSQSNTSQPVAEENEAGTTETTPEAASPLMITEEDVGKVRKPNASYAQLIELAILHSEQRKVTLSEIYTFIEDHFSFFRTAGPTWRNSVRHILTLNALFIKLPRPDHDKGKGSYWTIDPRKKKPVRGPPITLESLRRESNGSLLVPVMKRSQSPPESNRRHVAHGSVNIPILQPAEQLLQKPLGGIAEMRLPKRGRGVQADLNKAIPLVLSSDRKTLSAIRQSTKDLAQEGLSDVSIKRSSRPSGQMQTPQSSRSILLPYLRAPRTPLPRMRSPAQLYIPPMDPPLVPSQHQILYDHYQRLYPDSLIEGGQYAWPSPRSGTIHPRSLDIGLDYERVLRTVPSQPYPSMRLHTDHPPLEAESSRMARDRDEGLGRRQSLKGISIYGENPLEAQDRARLSEDEQLNEYYLEDNVYEEEDQLASPDAGDASSHSESSYRDASETERQWMSCSSTPPDL